MFLMGSPGSSERSGEFRPTVGRAHIDDTDRLKPRPRRLYPEQTWRLAVLNAAPEFPFCGDQEVLVERIGMNGKFDPLTAAGDDGEGRRSRVA